MIKTIKIMLIPNNKQRAKLLQSAGVSRFAYNWALGRQQENYKNGGKFISDNDMRKEFTQFKKLEEYKWLNDYSNNITKQAIKDSCNSYLRFFKKQAEFPKFKSKRKSKPSFYVDTEKLNFSETHIKLEKLSTSKKRNKQKFNWIRLSEKNRIPTNCKYINPRVTFDGLHWFISVGLEYPDNLEIPINDGIGIDLGIKDLAICSDLDKPYININKTNNIKKLEKKKCRLQRQVSRKYLKNKKEERYCKTCNIIKLEKKILKLTKRLTNIRHNHLHQTTTEIINQKPKFIVMEDLNVSGMMKNKHLSNAIAQQSFYEFYRQIQYKSEWNNIKFIVADRFFPSSKTCSKCGKIKKDLKLSDRTFKCNCGFIIDRDKNASINLANLGKSLV